jgi:hypothetical protein
MAFTRRQSFLSARTLTEMPAFLESAATDWDGLGRRKPLIERFFASIDVTRYRVTVNKATQKLFCGLITAQSKVCLASEARSTNH